MRVKLKDIGTIITGKTPSTKNKKFWDGNVCFITIEDMNNNLFISNTKRKITDTGLKSLGNNTISGTSILVNCVGNIGAVGITQLTCATNQQINSITNIEDICNPLFLYYKLQTMPKVFEKAAGQTILKILPKTVFENIEIDLPDRKIQDRIAEILSGIDEQINRNNEIVKKLQVLGNTIYSKIMCQPKTKILLGDIATMYQPETITSDKFVVDGQYPVYGAGGIIGFYDKCNHKDSELMLSCRGICGKAEISLPNSFIIGNQMVIKTKDEKMKWFLYNYLSNADLSKIETGSVQKQITRTNLEKMPIMLPPIESIHQYSDILKNIYDMKTKIIIENTKLNALKENLLPILINGQLSI